MSTRFFKAPYVAAWLGVSLSTLNAWLAKDSRRRPEDRRFQFHLYRGRKRVWTEAAIAELEAAVERESAPGGVLGGWRQPKQSMTTPSRAAAAEAAVMRVLSFQPGQDRHAGARRGLPAAPDERSGADDHAAIHWSAPP